MDKPAVTVKDGEGEVLRVLGADVRFLLEAAATGHRFSVMDVSLPKDQGPPPHEHPWDEAYFVISGRVRFVIGDAVRVFEAGDFVYAPGGVVHGFKGVEETPARVLVFDAPATAEGFFRDLDKETKAEPGIAPDIPAIAQRHGMRFLPPAAA